MLVYSCFSLVNLSKIKSFDWLLPTCVHVGHGEVHGGLPDGGDAHVDDGHVRLLGPQLADHPGPLAVLQAPVRSVRLHVKLKLKLEILGQGLKVMRNKI